MDIGTVYEEITKAFEKLSYSWKHSGPGQVIFIYIHMYPAKLYKDL